MYKKLDVNLKVMKNAARSVISDNEPKYHAIMISMSIYAFT